MARSRRDDEVFKNAMTGLPHAKSSTKAHASPKELPIASPSASILLISPTNRILLLHRVRTSTSFASAHVFPGGHVSPQDGPLPPPTSPSRHIDSLPYRHAAIRECFEESGILLAHDRNSSPTSLLSLPTPDLEAGRKAIHSETIPFTSWVSQRNGIIDTANLIPFTRWLTPGNLAKRFSTQMYLYFLPLSDSSSLSPETDKTTQMHIPTPDGGIEHTAAQFLYPSEWLDLSIRGEIVLYPPQFFLLHLISAYLKPPPPSSPVPTTKQLDAQRKQLLEFVLKDGDPPWGEKCISPTPLKRIENGRILIMGMGDAGPEVEGTGRRGDRERVLKVELMGDVERGRKRPSPREVVWRRDVFVEEKEKARL
ncbi:hypothetical protein JMJ35_008703 [Cladonia borealis]|uniref:Nudix hydrolase domain-containing protein n=1 Tax=Cladonia borealis TaxID=184061 RepID=A0AA39QU72_9LECA|nr:hypothetical protein JMJ35_008703 [Cladonia borealis]